MKHEEISGAARWCGFLDHDRSVRCGGMLDMVLKNTDTLHRLSIFDASLRVELGRRITSTFPHYPHYINGLPYASKGLGGKKKGSKRAGYMEYGVNM